MEQGTETFDKQQEEDGSHILRAIPSRINLQELQIKAIIIKSDSSTAVQNLAKQRAGQTLSAEVMKIVKQRQQLKIQKQTQYIPGVSNKITHSLSRLSTQGDYSVKKEIVRAPCQAWEITPTLDSFATGENKLIDKFMAM
ncbi:MAG: hypothetical protein EZS28_010928 [Streblomastix strix]|uniref:RNase H type-1 domain-containing protein n=1 Tax=Streblomastix strix TaxID=222440 RepID=A0A5J4WGA2_9EUKA|nr:MAG: hypothetical protein EZS28_010928 [Streblomastix strix]